MYLELTLVLVILLTIPILYDRCHQFKYLTKMFVYYLSMTIYSTFLIIPLSLPKPGNVENMILSAKLMQPIGKMLGFKYIVQGEGVKRLSDEKPYIVVVNHQHSLDLLALFEIWPTLRKMAVLSKIELLFAGPFGIAAWIAGTIFINRSNSEKSRKTLKQKVEKAKESNIKILLFPEGKRCHHPDRKEFLPFKKGAFASSIDAQIPILPIVISHYSFLDSKRMIMNEGVVKINILQPISPQGFQGKEGIEELSKLTRDRMLEKFQE